MRNLFKKVIVLIVFFILSSLNIVSQAELIVNGDFDSSLSPWVFDYNPAEIDDITIDCNEMLIHLDEIFMECIGRPFQLIYTSRYGLIVQVEHLKSLL